MKEIILEKSRAMDHLEALGHEVGSRKDLLGYMISTGVKPSDSGMYAKIHNKGAGAAPGRFGKRHGQLYPFHGKAPQGLSQNPRAVQPLFAGQGGAVLEDAIYINPIK